MKRPVIVKVVTSAEVLANLRKGDKALEKEILDRLMERVKRGEINTGKARLLFKKETGWWG